MKIHICTKCGQGVVGRRKCNVCRNDVHSVEIIRLFIWTFLLTMGIHYMGVTDTAEYSVLGRDAYQRAIFTPVPTASTVELSPDADIIQADISGLESQ